MTIRAKEWARRQVELDLELTRRFPVLRAKKRARMLSSPHAFLRGSAPLFYELLATHPELAGGPEGDGWIVGDMHLENMGAYKSDGGSVVFDLNDFDDAAIAPRRWDALRLSTSLILSARAHRVPAAECIELGERLIEHYALAASGERMSEPPPMAPPMFEIVERSMKRSKRDLLDARAPMTLGRRRFLRGDRYLELSPELASLAASLVPKLVEVLGSRAPSRARSWRIEDVAQRVAGTGSIGRVRFAILVADDQHEERVLDFKEAAPSSTQKGSKDPLSFAKRVVEGANALVAAPPKLLAAIEAPAEGVSFIGRQLCPQEDKLDVSKLSDPRMIGSIAERAGFMLGSAHARSGGVSASSASWPASDRSALIDRAVELAGLYEAIYLAFARASS